MEFSDIVKSRRSIRQYQTLAVREATIEELLEIIGFSVSAINLQPWKIKVVNDHEIKYKLFAATFGMNHVRTCSHLLILCADTDYLALIEKLARLQEAAGVDPEMRQRKFDFATSVSSSMTPEGGSSGLSNRSTSPSAMR